jgi:hypothetical protein
MHPDFRNIRVEDKQHAAQDGKIEDQLRDRPLTGKDALDDHHDPSGLKRRNRSLAVLDFSLTLPKVGIHTGLNRSNIWPAMKVQPC